MHADTLTGQAFEDWLFDPNHRTLPDFLLMPEITFGMGLIKNDIQGLRMLASAQPGQRPSPALSASLARLRAAGIIEVLTTAAGSVYVMSPYSYEVLLHNVSFRE